MIITRTPYRISFFGGGSDYPDYYMIHGGAVLAASIDKYCYISCRELPPFFSHKYRIAYSSIETVRNINEIEHPAVRGVFRHLNVQNGLEVQHHGDLPARRVRAARRRRWACGRGGPPSSRARRPRSPTPARWRWRHGPTARPTTPRARPQRLRRCIQLTKTERIESKRWVTTTQKTLKTIWIVNKRIYEENGRQKWTNLVKK